MTFTCISTIRLKMITHLRQARKHFHSLQKAISRVFQSKPQPNYSPERNLCLSSDCFSTVIFVSLFRLPPFQFLKHFLTHVENESSSSAMWFIFFLVLFCFDRFVFTSIDRLHLFYVQKKVIIMIIQYQTGALARFKYNTIIPKRSAIHFTWAINFFSPLIYKYSIRYSFNLLFDFNDNKQFQYNWKK